MKFTNIILASAIAITLVACGESVPDTSAPSVETVEKPAPAKFKGAKFAPPRDVMSRTAAAEIWDREGARKITPGEACKSVRRMSQMTPECQTEYDNLLARSVFLPSECRKGDERKGYNNKLQSPVSCDGEIQTPAGTGQVTMIFHKVDNEWKAWYGSMVSGSWQSR